MMRKTIICSTCCFAFLLCQCGSNDRQVSSTALFFPVSVEVIDDEGIGVSAVPVQFGKVTVGYTDADGKFRAHMKREPGASFELSVANISNYTFSTKTSLETVLAVYALDHKIIPEPVKLIVQATSNKKVGWLWVRAYCDETLQKSFCTNLPVEINGVVRGYTNAVGVAQIYLKEFPQTRLSLRVDTPSTGEILQREKEKNPNASEIFSFEPSDPKYNFIINNSASIYLLDIFFHDALAKEKKEKKVTTQPLVREQVSTTKKKHIVRKKTRKKKRPSGIINVFK